MDSKAQIPYIAYEATVDRLDKQLKRMFVIILVLVLLLVGTNAGWLWYESQFVDEVYTVEAYTDDGGDAFANAGDFVYGQSESNG